MQRTVDLSYRWRSTSSPIRASERAPFVLRKRRGMVSMCNTINNRRTQPKCTKRRSCFKRRRRGCVCLCLPSQSPWQSSDAIAFQEHWPRVLSSERDWQHTKVISTVGHPSFVLLRTYSTSAVWRVHVPCAKYCRSQLSYPIRRGLHGKQTGPHD